MSAIERFDLEPAFILHRRNYLESSLILEIFTRSRGRQAVIARGCKRPNSRIRGLVQAFNPILVSCQGRGELLNLRQVESAGPPVALRGRKLLCGLYINELLCRLTSRGEPQAHLFQRYAETLSLLFDQAEEPLLRRFECDLLDAMGYQIDFRHAIDGLAIDAHKSYLFDPQQGFEDIGTRVQLQSQAVQGASLLNFTKGLITDFKMLQDLKRITRVALAFQLGPKPLETRRLL